MDVRYGLAERFHNLVHGNHDAARHVVEAVVEAGRIQQPYDARSQVQHVGEVSAGVPWLYLDGLAAHRLARPVVHHRHHGAVAGGTLHGPVRPAQPSAGRFKAVEPSVAARDKLAGVFGDAVQALRIKRDVLFQRHVGGASAVDAARTDVDEPLHPGEARQLKHVDCTGEVDVYKALAVRPFQLVQDHRVHCGVDDAIHPLARGGLLQRRRVQDIRLRPGDALLHGIRYSAAEGRPAELCLPRRRHVPARRAS